MVIEDRVEIFGLFVAEALVQEKRHAGSSSKFNAVSIELVELVNEFHLSPAPCLGNCLFIRLKLIVKQKFAYTYPLIFLP